MKRSQKIGLSITAGALVLSALVVMAVPFILRKSGICAYTVMFDNKFGDQHMKTAVALLELYKTRHGRYPDDLTDIDFMGDWDQIVLHSVDYSPNQQRTAYYLDVTRGWLCKPDLRYPPEFWQGTGYRGPTEPEGGDADEEEP